MSRALDRRAGLGDRRRVLRCWMALLLFVGLASSGAARADDIAAAARGVVRVVTIAVVDGQVVGFGHGSGFAVAPGRIITNAHVVELAQRYPENVVIGVVPSEGSRSFRARVVAYDEHRDLALLQFQGDALPAETLSTTVSGAGDRVVSLGYPGDVDVATAQSAADYIRPTSPVRTEGGVGGARTLGGIGVVVHTAGIARGNSGGPLLDPCGRVLGVNSAITQGEQGDANFGFAIDERELAGFLSDAGQPFRSVSGPCTSIEDRLRTDGDAEARAGAAADAARAQAATRDAVAGEAARASARAEAQRRREDVMAVAALLLVAAGVALSGAGTLLAVRRRRWAAAAAALGVLLAVAATLAFLNRPGEKDAVLAPVPASVARSDLPAGPLACRFLPDASRVTVSAPRDVRLDWGAAGCADGHRQFVADAAGSWTRVEVPDDEDAVTVARFDPATRRYALTRYLLSAEQMRAARAGRGPAVAACEPGEAAAAALAARQSTLVAALPPLPNEKLAYQCGGR